MSETTTKTRKRSKTCQCIDSANEALQQCNAKIKRHPMLSLGARKISMSPPSIGLEKLDSKNRKPLPTLFATYCPFCGKKYSE